MSNRLSAVITKLQLLKEEYGDLEVVASTQDGASYNVYDDYISIDRYINQNGEIEDCVYIQ